jgi:hypothetical protein
MLSPWVSRLSPPRSCPKTVQLLGVVLPLVSLRRYFLPVNMALPKKRGQTMNNWAGRMVFGHGFKRHTVLDRAAIVGELTGVLVLVLAIVLAGLFHVVKHRTGREFGVFHPSPTTLFDPSAAPLGPLGRPA